MLLEWIVNHPLWVIIGIILLYRFWRASQPFPDVPGVDSVHNVDEWRETLEKNPLVLADFYATQGIVIGSLYLYHPGNTVSGDQAATPLWCPPCRQSAPLFGAIADRYKGKCKFVKVNVDEAGDIARLNSVKSMPTFKFFRDGKELDTIVGWNQNKVMGILEKESSSL